MSEEDKGVSSGDTREKEVTKEAVQQFYKDVEAALHALGAKYKDKINDLAVVVNWTPENHAKPYPKLIVETFRGTMSETDLINQGLALSELMSRGSLHLMSQMLFKSLSKNNSEQKS